jgi:hypothetical protein
VAYVSLESTVMQYVTKGVFKTLWLDGL